MPQADTAAAPTPAATSRIRAAAPADLPAIVGLIRALAEYEQLTHLLAVDEARLAPHLFGERPVAECLIAESLVAESSAAGLQATAGAPEHGDDAPAAAVGAVPEAPTVVGFALFFPNYSTFLAQPGIHLEDLFVLPAWRGRGIGQALLRHLAGLAVERGCGRLEWHVLDWNTPAIEFYSAMGATVLPDWRLCRVTGAALPGMAAGS